MAKEKQANPLQAAKKAEKARQIKKSKANLQAQRNEKLARRNPLRLQREIDDLKALEQSGSLRPHDRNRLQQLEKDVGAIRKARETLGDKAPQFPERRGDRDNGGRGHGGGVLGKRRRDDRGPGRRDAESSSDTDADVQDIPMPKDTPPPIPRRRNISNANETPLGQSRIPHALPPKPAAQITYSAAPQIRDLRKEATARFMPAAVQNKMRLAKGQGRLLEPEELERLEKEGYRDAEKIADAAVEEAQYGAMAHGGGTADTELDDAEADLERELREMEAEERHGGVARDVENAAEAVIQEAQHDMMAAEARGEMEGTKAEGKKAENVLRHVGIEEVEDEDL